MAMASRTTHSGEDAPFRIRLSIRKTADRLIVDFAGTDPQVKGPMNAPLSVTASGVFCGLKTAIDPNNLIPPNSGCWRAHRDQGPQGLGGQCRISRRRWSTPTTKCRIAWPTW